MHSWHLQRHNDDKENQYQCAREVEQFKTLRDVLRLQRLSCITKYGFFDQLAKIARRSAKLYSECPCNGGFGITSVWTLMLISITPGDPPGGFFIIWTPEAMTNPGCSNECERS